MDALNQGQPRIALLASVYASQGEPDRACAIGTKALDLTSQLRSARAVRYLRDLQAQLIPHRRQQPYGISSPGST